MIDHGGKVINVDPRLESSKQYKQLCLRLLRLTHDVSDDSEACAMVWEGVLELEKKVVAIRLSNQSHGTCDTTIEARQHLAESSTSKVLALRRKMVQNKRSIDV